jgi:dATP pyrophosphohydrolase
MRLPFQVAVYPARIIDGEPEFLLLLRNQKRGGFWQGVSGGVEDGESFIEAAEREIKEETNLSPKTLSEIDFSYTFPVEDQWKYLYVDDVTIITEHVFAARLDSNIEPKISSEHVDYQWCRFDKAYSLLKWPLNKEGLNKSYSFFRTNWVL